MKMITINDTEIVLTNIGEEKVNAYLAELKAKRKEILDAKKDTVDETELPTIEDILLDIYSFEEDNEYYNNWGVTDNYDSDYPLHLEECIDYWFFNIHYKKKGIKTVATMTINEMIYKTLTTKMTKEPKYRKELEALGLEIVINDWSDCYNYWLVRNPATGRELVINKDYSNRKNIFNPYNSIIEEGHDIKKINFFGYLNCDRPSLSERLPKESKYKKWRVKLRSNKRYILNCKKDIQGLQEKKRKLDETIQYYEERLSQYQTENDNIRCDINKIKTRKEV